MVRTQFDKTLSTKSIEQPTSIVRNLPVSASAKSLVIDSFLARMCWIQSEEGKVECSDLSGNNLRTIYEVTVFGDVRLLSLTLDGKGHVLYFMTHVSNLESLGKVQILRCSLKTVGGPSYKFIFLLSLSLSPHLLGGCLLA